MPAVLGRTGLIASPLPDAFQRTTAGAVRAFENPKAFSEYQATLNHRLRDEVDSEFFGHWDVTPTPLHLLREDWKYIQECSRVLFRVVEKVVTMYVNGNEELDHLFRRYSLFRPYMTKRFMSWQEYGRYDFIVNQRGRPVFIELNTAMASGYLPMSHVNRLFGDSAPDFLRPVGERLLLPYDDSLQLGQEIARMERLADARHGAVAILVDENGKYHESEMIKTSLEAAGREVVIADVRDLRRQGGNLFIGSKRISTTYNKFRLFGAAHHWSQNAYVDNRAFLEAVANNRVLSINNFAAMTISEDKCIFQAMRLPSVMASLSPIEQECVALHTPATFVMEPGPVSIDGREVDLASHVRAHRAEFVIKPRSDYRGSDAYSGRDHGEAEWKDVVDRCMDGNYLAQARVDAAMFEVTGTVNGQVEKKAMRMAGGIYFADMDFQGLVARAAPWEIVNAINHAHVLPIYCTDN